MCILQAGSITSFVDLHSASRVYYFLRRSAFCKQGLFTSFVDLHSASRVYYFLRRSASASIYYFLRRSAFCKQVYYFLRRSAGKSITSLQICILQAGSITSFVDLQMQICILQAGSITSFVDLHSASRVYYFLRRSAFCKQGL